MINLHLGCWHRYIPGWVHVDLCDFAHIDHKTSIDDLSMFENNSVDLIYCSHALEYFGKNEAHLVVREWARVLKPGALLRVAVPNFDALVTVYQTTGDLSKVLGPLYGEMKIQSAEGPQMLFHKTVYNFEALRDLLELGGFGNVKEYRWQDTIHKDYDDHSQAYFPHMDKEKGLLISLNVECEKL